MIKLFFDYFPLSLLALISVAIVVGAVVYLVKIQIDFSKEKRKKE